MIAKTRKLVFLQDGNDKRRPLKAHVLLLESDIDFGADKSIEIVIPNGETLGFTTEAYANLNGMNCHGGILMLPSYPLSLVGRCRWIPSREDSPRFESPSLGLGTIPTSDGKRESQDIRLGHIGSVLLRQPLVQGKERAQVFAALSSFLAGDLV